MHHSDRSRGDVNEHTLAQEAPGVPGPRKNLVAE